MGGFNQGIQVTGNESTDLDLLVKAAVEEEYKKRLEGNNDQQDQNKGPGPLKLKVFGNEHTFNTPEEASAAVEQALQAARQAAIQAQQQVVQQVQPQETKSAETGSGFSREKFAEKIAEDPLKGLDYALGHLIFNGKVEEGASQILRTQLQDVETQKQVMAAYQFREANPHFPANPQAVQILDGIRQELGLGPNDARSWEAANAVAIQRRLLPSAEQVQQWQIQQAAQYQQTQQQNGPIAPPAMGRSNAGPTPDWIRKAEDLSEEKLEALINSFSGGR